LSLVIRAEYDRALFRGPRRIADNPKEPNGHYTKRGYGYPARWSQGLHPTSILRARREEAAGSCPARIADSDGFLPPAVDNPEAVAHPAGVSSSSASSPFDVADRVPEQLKLGKQPLAASWLGHVVLPLS
jgi:hypothetical protein